MVDPLWEHKGDRFDGIKMCEESFGMARMVGNTCVQNPHMKGKHVYIWMVLGVPESRAK